MQTWWHANPEATNLSFSLLADDQRLATDDYPFTAIPINSNRPPSSSGPDPMNALAGSSREKRFTYAALKGSHNERSGEKICTDTRSFMVIPPSASTASTT